jgi:hypothetical protein
MYLSHEKKPGASMLDHYFGDTHFVPPANILNGACEADGKGRESSFPNGIINVMII